MPLARWIHRFLAAVLVMGGGLGVLFGVLLTWSLASEDWQAVGLALSFAALFVWPLSVGVLLWQGNRRARLLAMVLFASQIPILQLPWLSAHWFSGLSVALMFRPGVALSNDALSLSVGSGGELQWATAASQTGVGLNIFAVLALVMLLVLKTTCKTTRDVVQTA